MDPTAALNELLDALRIADRETAFDRLEALLDWLSKGGSFPQVPESQPDATYQGYTNRATWTVGLMLMNDQGLYLFCHRLRHEACSEAEHCPQVIDGTWTEPNAQRYLLADRLKKFVDELNPIRNRPSAFADLLSDALEDVNFDELAETFLE